jgi:hypothetical protein
VNEDRTRDGASRVSDDAARKAFLVRRRKHGRLLHSFSSLRAADRGFDLRTSCGAPI